MNYITGTLILDRKYCNFMVGQMVIKVTVIKVTNALNNQTLDQGIMVLS